MAGQRCHPVSGGRAGRWGLTWPGLGSLGAPETLLRPSTYTTSQHAWSSLCRLLPALMTLPGQSDHIRLDTRPGPGITPTLDIHTHSLACWPSRERSRPPGIQARVRRRREAGRGTGSSVWVSGPSTSQEGRPQHLSASGPHPWLRGIPEGAGGGGVEEGGDVCWEHEVLLPCPSRPYFPPETQSILLAPGPQHPTLMGTPTLILKPRVKVSAALARRKCCSPDPERGIEIGQGWKSTWPAQESPDHPLFQNRKVTSWRGGHGSPCHPPRRDQQHPLRPQCSARPAQA